jgi:hypothetical protein
VVYAAGEFSKLAPPALPVSPDWSPVKRYGGYASAREKSTSRAVACAANSPQACRQTGAHQPHRSVWGESGLWTLGCDCFAW